MPIYETPSTYLASLQNALKEAFETDKKIFLLGEDLLDPYGGAFKVSQGLSTLYPDRVLTTPVSESAVVGVAAGMALRGFRPIVEIMFGDFLALCADQIVNHLAKFQSMYRNQLQLSMVIRTPMGAGRGYGPTHSQSLEKIFLGVPGMTVAAPSHLHDPGKLLQYAILRHTEPVLFIEHKLLYPVVLIQNHEKLQIQYEEEIKGFPTAILSNFLHGAPDLTIISYGGTSRLVVPVLEKMIREEIRLLAVFPSSLKPVPIRTLEKSAAASGRVLIVEEGTESFNWGSEIASLLYETLWGNLISPVHRLSSKASIVPAGKEQEETMLISPQKIEEAIQETLLR